jgi:hypothetical protein
MKHEPGMKVLIIEDCRPDGKAAGQIGTYEGDQPYSVNVSIYSVDREFDYKSFMKWNDEQDNPLPALGDVNFDDDPCPQPEGNDLHAAFEHFEKWTEWAERNKYRMAYYVVRENPQIHLDDGSVIWGIECWWTPVDGAPPLEEAQRQTEETKSLFRKLLAGEGEEERYE